MSEVIKSKSIQRIAKEMKVCQLICKMHHDIKTQEEATHVYNGNESKLSYDDTVKLIKEYVKPKSKYHYNPTGAKAIALHGKGALVEAIEKAKVNDFALYDDLNRLSKRPDEAYKKEGFKWSKITGNISTR